ncbi:homoserine dehydrogenase [Thermosulfurimonas marina]|uniref:Homoserine dehydrogenase n=1 Tax=Thermosulfurimonas marina TaxID=2047767 RepID=A0A6H1WRK5_9BACT|nr:homoserine dehydrogenase [Thermosulfurimonas marina]QJA05789.1 homoserine dehydrogenase [Thermosulfurimonas marina]
MQEIGIGLLGLGTVGSGLVRLLEKNGEFLARKTGIRLRLRRILVRDPEKPRGVSVSRKLLTTDFEEILSDPGIQIVCELMGGLEPARTYILRALKAGKYVVTANKAVLSTYGPEVFAAAEARGVGLFFEAAVGGGVPIVKALRESLSANRIRRLTAIVNGTCNYILTRMTEEGLPFSEALREAQARGFAEADPQLDVSGADSAHKLAILATLAYGGFLPAEKVYTEGIETLEPLDIQFARELGLVPKLLAIGREEDGRVEVRVHPTLVPETHVLASVREAYNGFLLEGDFVGSVLLYGLGAGGEPTASAVAADLLDAARFLQAGARPGPILFRDRPLEIKPLAEVESRYYFRFSAVDRPGVLSKISGILGAYEISIASVIQKGREEGGPVPIVMLTHEAREASVRQALSEIDRLEVVTAPTRVLRILED